VAYCVSAEELLRGASHAEAMTRRETCEAVIGRLRAKRLPILLVVDDGEDGLEVWIDTMVSDFPRSMSLGRCPGGCNARTGRMHRVVWAYEGLWEEWQDENWRPTEARPEPDRLGADIDRVIGWGKAPKGEKDGLVVEGELQNKSKLWALMLIDADFDDSRLSLAARGVYVHLCRRADKAHVAWPGIDSIAATCCVTKPTVIRAIRELERRGFLRVARENGRRSNYEILPKHCWKPLPNFDRSKIDTGKKEVTAQSKRGNGGVASFLPPPVKNEERKDNHRRITNKRITTTTTTHEENKPIRASSSPSSYGFVLGREREDSASSLVIKSESDERYSPQYPAQDDVSPISREGTEPAFAQDQDRITRSQRLADGRESASSGAALGLELAKEFGLSGNQRQRLAEYCESHGVAYLEEKAQIVRSQPCRNAAGAFLAALREDWQPAVSIETGAMTGTMNWRKGWAGNGNGRIHILPSLRPLDPGQDNNGLRAQVLFPCSNV
jgi:Helix-turn-helix domain